MVSVINKLLVEVLKWKFILKDGEKSILYLLYRKVNEMPQGMREIKLCQKYIKTTVCLGYKKKVLCEEVTEFTVSLSSLT